MTSRLALPRSVAGGHWTWAVGRGAARGVQRVLDSAAQHSFEASLPLTLMRCRALISSHCWQLLSSAPLNGKRDLLAANY